MKFGVGNREPVVVQHWHELLHEPVAQRFVRVALYPPANEQIAIFGRWPEEVHDGFPPTVERILEQVALYIGAVRKRQQHLFAMAHVEAFFGDDAAEDAAVRTIRALLQHGLLRSERGSIDEERNDDLVGPGLGFVMEDVVELRVPVHEIVDHLGSGLDAEIGGDHVEQMRVADLILRFGQEGELAVKAGCPRYPVPLTQATEEFGVGMHLDEPEHLFAVYLRHVVARLHDAAAVEKLLERSHVSPGAHPMILLNERSVCQCIALVFQRILGAPKLCCYALFMNFLRSRSALAAISSFVALGSLGVSSLPASAASSGGSCAKIDAISTSGTTRLVCSNIAASGKRPKLRWTVLTTPTTVAAGSTATPTPAAPKVKLTVYSGRTYGIEDVYKRFTRETGIELEVVSGNDPANRSRLAQEGSRTPADVYLTVDVASLVGAADEGLLSPVSSTVLTTAIPTDLRDAKNRWFGLTRRARVIYVNTRNVAKADIPTRYEDLATPKWADRLCSRPSSHVYTLSFAANIIAAYGGNAVGILSGIAKNTKSENFIDSDTRIIETINAGGCDAGIANTYYYFRPGLKRENVALVFPNQSDTDRGVHVNVSGAGVVAASDDKANAQRFIEWLATDGSADFANGNAEYPVNPKTVVRDDVKPYTSFRADQGRIDDYSKMQSTAVIVLTDAGWK